MSQFGPPIDVRPLLAAQHAGYLTLLRALAEDDWSRDTGCPGWTVQDVAAHVLADHAGRLSAWRDGHHTEHPEPGEPFPSFIHRINDQWVRATRRLSPRLLTELTAELGHQVIEFWQTVDPNAPGWPVSWAGPDPAPLWFDAARDLTEYWTHEQHIRDATARPTAIDHPQLHAVLETFLRALPHTLRETPAPDTTTVQFNVTGPGGGTWTCIRTGMHWRHTNHHQAPTVQISLDTDTAWRLCTRAITPGTAEQRAHVRGDSRLADAAMAIVSIIR